MLEPGEVEIELGGRKEILRPTLRAAKAVNALGGFIEAFRRLASFDLDAYSVIVAAGLSTSKRTIRAGDVEEDVYEAGLSNLTAPLSDFVGILANGGKPATESDKKDESPPGEG